jgi:hypothetical protein
MATRLYARTAPGAGRCPALVDRYGTVIRMKLDSAAHLSCNSEAGEPSGDGRRHGALRRPRLPRSAGLESHPLGTARETKLFRGALEIPEARLI